MKKFLSIIANEFRYFLTDKGVMLIMIIGVIAYSLCYTIPYYNEVVKEVPIGVIDFDQTNMSKNFIRNLDATDYLDITEQFTSLEETERHFYKGDIKGFVVIPKDFQRDVMRGKQVDISAYGDSAYLIIYKAFYSGVVQTAIETGARIEIGKMMKSGIPKHEAIALKQPFEFVQTPLYNPAGGYKSYVYPVILILILHQTFLIGLGLTQGTKNEKRKKYCDNYNDIPITILGRSTTYFILYLLYALVFFLMYPLIFIYPMHYNFIPMLVMYTLMMYAAAFFGQTIFYWFNTRETVILTMVTSSLIFIFLPGLIWPRETIPAIINFISFFIPATCGIDGIVKINQNGAGFGNVIYDYLWLLFLCALYFISAVYLTQKKFKEFDRDK